MEFRNPKRPPYEHRGISRDGLVEIISDGNPNKHHDGPVVVMVYMTDGRVVTGSYYKGSELPDLRDVYDFFSDLELLDDFVGRLLEGGQAFTLSLGEAEEECTFIWEVKTE